MERDGGRWETNLAWLGRLRRADGPCKPLWHIKKKAPRGTCFRVCNVQVAEGMGPMSNLLHLSTCFDVHYFQMTRSSAVDCLSPILCFGAARSTPCYTMARGTTNPDSIPKRPG